MTSIADKIQSPRKGSLDNVNKHYAQIIIQEISL